MAEPIVIVDAAGTEHEFPAGFDPKRAGEIVRQKTTAPATSGMPRDARGMPAVSSDASDAGASPLAALLGPYAHPESLTDFARILTLPVDQVRRAVAATLTTAAARQAATTTRQAVSTTAQAGARAGGAALTAVDPDLVSIASPRAGAALKVAQRAQKVIGKYGAAAAPAAEEGAVSVPGYPRVGTTPAPVAPPPIAVRPPTARPPAAPAAVVDEFTAARTAKASAALPDQKALNEAALAARRAAYSATKPSAAQAAVTAAETAAKARITLTSDESKEFIRLITHGMPGPEAMAAVKQARTLAANLGGPTAKEVAAAILHREGTGKW